MTQSSGSIEKDRVERMQELEDREQGFEMLFSGHKNKQQHIPTCDAHKVVT